MPNNCCPKTCSQLSVAAILISVGIIQFLAGIILLKSQDIHLLAGTDFVVAISNLLVGSLLGIAANVWEKKKKVVSLKNTARQNVLAGLYIAVLTMNATAAIIMILGDGNKLLTSKGNTDVSGDFVFEILACAYVTSVCSPIVCLVIALVCLSGNRIQIYENMKKKDSITKKESYGWVFENNHDSQSRNLGSVFKDSSVRNASVSDDNVFDEQKSVAEKLFKIKPSKKNKARNSFTSLSELKSPMEIWAHKRKKIIEEITSPKPIFFADDYLQFPEHKYDSYIGTLIPRITQTSFIQTSSRDNTQVAQTADSEILERKMAKVDKTMSCKPSKPHLDELNLKLASRRMSYPDSACLNGQINSNKENLNGLPIATIEDVRKSIDEPDAQTPHSAHSMLHRTYANSVGDIETQSDDECFDFAVAQSLRSGSHKDIAGHQNSSDWLQNPYNLRRNSNDSGSSGLTAETISELKAKINKMNFDEDENLGQKAEYFRSFKHDSNKRKSHLSESDVEDKRSEFQKLHDQYGIFSQNSESDSKNALAGEIVPISIRPATINRVGSIPLKTICSQAPSRYSLNVKNKISDHKLDMNSDESKLILPNGESGINQRNNSFSSSCKEESTNQSDIEFNSVSIKQSDRKCDFKQRMSVMGSIAESPTEEFLQIAHQHQRPVKTDSSPEENSPKNGIRYSRNFNSRRISLKAAPSLLNRLWSMKRSDTKTDLTSLIMDTDSLVGLSDDDLMARSRRLRQLRKSVELRSRAEKHDDVV